MFALLLAFASTASGTPLDALTPAARASDDWGIAAEKCGVMFKADGVYQTRVLPGFSVIERTAGAHEFTLPADAPPNVEAVECGRDSVVPRDDDYKVLGAGYLLFIIVEQGDRVVSLEFAAKKLRATIAHGRVSAGEQAQIDAALLRAQKKIDALRASRPPGA